MARNVALKKLSVFFCFGNELFQFKIFWPLQNMEIYFQCSVGLLSVWILRCQTIGAKWDMSPRVQSIDAALFLCIYWSIYWIDCDGDQSIILLMDEISIWIKSFFHLSFLLTGLCWIDCGVGSGCVQWTNFKFCVETMQ